MKKIAACVVSLVAGLGLAGAVSADDKTPGTDAKSLIFPQGWYVAPMFSYSFLDKGRGAGSHGMGGAIALGNRSDIAAIELAGLYTAASGSGKLTGAELTLLVGPFFEQDFLARFFGVVSFGLLSEKNVPAEKQNSSNIIGDAGLGYMQPIEWFGWKMNIRSEVRYRYDYQQPPQPAGSPSNFKDWVVNLGLQIPLSQPPKPAETAPPVTVVPAAEAPLPAPPPAAPAPVEAAPIAPPAETKATEASPINLETAKAGDTIVLSGVNFNSGKASLTLNAKMLLDGVAKQLMARPTLKVEIGGHTDSTGTQEGNAKLSERRANSVRDYLVGKGVSTEQLTAVGYGQDHPVDTNDTPEGREKNRRVEMKVTGS